MGQLLEKRLVLGQDPEKNKKERRKMKRQDIVNVLIERGFKAEMQENVKNGIIVEGIMIQGDDPIAPIIYTDRLIRDAEAQGKILEDVVAMVLRIYEENKHKGLDLGKIFDPEFIKSHVYLGLQKKSDEDLLKESCYLEGLEVYLYVREDSEHDGIYTMKVKKDFLERVGLDEKEVWECARANTSADTVVRTMAEVIAEMCGMSCDEISADEPPMYVVSNKNCTRGASAVLDKKVLEDIGRKHGTDTLIILPSSIHEVLVVPYEDGMDMDFMRSMVTEVNTTEVLPEDQLISDAYKVTVTI